jgi:hypothetical protein
MLARLEQIITEYFPHISLDNKLEFLVCARICSYQTPLFERIYIECEASLSPEGIFLVDTLNDNRLAGTKTFAGSEHRNVLFIMSGSPYTPHNTLV